MKMSYLCIWMLSLLLSLPLSGKDKGKDSARYVTWYLKDAEKDRIPGTGMERAFQELLKRKKPSRVIVAVIDGGMDIRHRELQDHLWKNDDEIPWNEIDDDHNGYIDDTCGWNFLGGPGGRSIDYETVEVTRLYRQYKTKIDSMRNGYCDSLTEPCTFYMQIADEYEKKLKEAKETLSLVSFIEEMYSHADSIIRLSLQKENYSLQEVKKLKPVNKEAKTSKKLILFLEKQGVSLQDIKEMKQQYEEKVKYHYNINYSPRQEIIGDDPAVNSNRFYGNNHLSFRPYHATAVAGIIVKINTLAKTVNGISDSIVIMPVVAIPDGDEYDKDVANAIRYATDNGARIINMSFGKGYSPYKAMVDSALRYAEEKGVLLIHAAGNDASNIDKKMSYPSFLTNDSHQCNNGITVGASTPFLNRHLIADFSNYGKKNTDLFAPGTYIYAPYPANTYRMMEGTSFSAPVVTGIAAAIFSYYPELSASEVKEIIIGSTRKFPRKRFFVPSPNEKKRKKKKCLSELCVSGGIVDGYAALRKAEEYMMKHKTAH